MQIAITGASGYLGRQLVPYLQARGVKLLLVGRDPASLMRTFPGIPAIGYQDIAQQAQGCELLLHLAVVNNHVAGASVEDFKQVNVDLAVETCLQAQRAGIGTFIYASSTHALDHANKSLYAQSKRSAAVKLEDIRGIDVRILYLPAVLGDRLAGKLRVVNAVPRPLRSVVLSCLRALKPTVRAEKIGDAVLLYAQHPTPKEKSAIITDGQDTNAAFRVFKRALDLAAAFAIILLLWWAMAVIWLAVRMQSPGPGFFRQERVGREGKVFTCYKFRTMHVATPNVGTHEVTASAVTALGAFLRRSKLDELPQVLNILLNQMSLVGPRPCLPSQMHLIEERRRRGVLSAKPGITGLAQVNGIDMSEPTILAEWDERYLKLQSILMDARIILMTAMGKGGGDRVR